MLKIKIAGSKSITNRALLLNYLTGNKTKLHNLARSTDSDYLLKCLKLLNNRKSFFGSDTRLAENLNRTVPRRVQEDLNFQHNAVDDPKNDFLNLYTHNAGTTTRFLTALATLLERPITITGDARMNERPIKELTDALNQLGAKTEPSKNGCPPITIHPQKLRGGKATIRGEISSQYLTALLLILPFAEKDSEITIRGNLCSKPYIDITLKLLKEFGLKIQNNKYKKFTIPGNQLAKLNSLKKDEMQGNNERLSEPYTTIRRGRSETVDAADRLFQRIYQIEPDMSSASYPAAYAALHPTKPFHLENIFKNSIQGDIIFLQHLRKMGCKITQTQTGTTIQGPKTLKPLNTIDMNECPDLVMTFAVLAAFANGQTKITNISNLRVKESDRLEALKNELTRLNIPTKTTKSTITIEGNPKRQLPENIQIHTYDDHRIAMSFAILQDMVKGLQIENPTCTEKSYKTFWQDLKKLQK